MKTKSYYGFDKFAGVAVIAIHTFEAAPDGQLNHLIDGRLRASVPPEGWADYCRNYPEAKDIVDALTIKPAAQLEILPDSQVQSLEEQLAQAQAKIAALTAAAPAQLQ